MFAAALRPRRWCVLVAAFSVTTVACESPRAAADAGLPLVVNDVQRIQLAGDYRDLTIGDAPRRYNAYVTRVSGRVDTVPVTSITASDTNVVQVVDGAVIAKNVGNSALRIEVEGQRVRAAANVRERVFADSVWLGPGEVRAWELQPSWYRITVDAQPFPGEPQTLELGADLICVPESQDPKTIACRVRENTRVILRHTGVSKRREKALAVVVIYRTSR
jgi:hypothetical protein